MPDTFQKKDSYFGGLFKYIRSLNSRASQIIILVLLLGFIITWQLNFAFHPEKQNTKYKLEASTGLRHRDVPQFTYFLYYLNLFPIRTTLTPLPMSKEGARFVLENHGDTLYMDTRSWALRFGFLWRGYMYLPHAIFKGSPTELSVRPFHSAVFILSLLMLFTAFYLTKQSFLGLLIVLFLGSNPFQLREVYVSENIFGWVITTAIITLAINLPLLGKKSPTLWYYIAPLLTGLFLGAVMHIRSEPCAIILSVICVYLTISGISWRKRLTILLLFFSLFAVMNFSLHKYFDPLLSAKKS